MGVGLTLGLGALTVLAVAWNLRGSLFDPENHFGAKISAVAVATQLANYHNNVHGATILAIPFALVLAKGRPSLLTRALLFALLWVPYSTLLDVVVREILKPGLWPPLYWAPLAPLLMFGLLVSLLRDIATQDSTRSVARSR